MGWKGWSSAERAKELGKTLKRSCAKIVEMEIGLSAGGPLQKSRSYFDLLEMKQKGFMDVFKDAHYGAEVTAPLSELCELIVAERASDIVSRMEAWLGGRRGRRVVDFRFDTDSKLCSGGVLSVCDTVFDQRRVSAEDDEEDDREL